MAVAIAPLAMKFMTGGAESYKTLSLVMPCIQGYAIFTSKRSAHHMRRWWILVSLRRIVCVEDFEVFRVIDV
jgi:hypothetical protein